ncbi:hypothetical protein BOX15_Mlig031147g2 [Macrostomum lignano]|uniref:Uncharacterized protein n=1 Tax=Macrostomum lignano TaxID=282301 RepID=A0A267EFK3_9PLAT|nr:hypothetical protein BOX15_Mlig031147g2 [Macrostomum lignano]
MPSEGKPKLTPLLIQQQQHRQPMDSPTEAEASNPAGANNTELLSPVEQQTIRLGGNAAATSASGAAPAEADGGDGEEVAVAAVRHRRTRGRQSLKRLSDIMSAYIPVNGDSAQQQQHRQDRRPLLESHPENDGGEPDPAPSVSIGCGPRLVKLLDLASLCCSQDAPIDQSEAAEPEDPGCASWPSEISPTWPSRPLAASSSWHSPIRPASCGCSCRCRSSSRLPPSAPRSAPPATAASSRSGRCATGLG